MPSASRSAKVLTYTWMASQVSWSTSPWAGRRRFSRNLVKPNQLVRLVLPTAAGQLTCKGRIVWVLYEQPGTSLSVYRMGVKFIDVDAKAVEDFMRDFAEEPPMQSQPSSGTA